MTNPAGSPAAMSFAALVHRGGVHRLGHGDLAPGHRHRAALVHADDLGGALAGQDDGEFVDGHHRGAGFLGHGHGFAHVVAVAVGHQDEVHRPHLIHRGVERRVAEPGVDEHIHPGAGQFKGRVAQKGYLYAPADFCLRHDALLFGKVQGSKFKVQGSKLTVWPSWTFHNLRVGQRPMYDCEKIFRRVRLTRHLI